MAWIAYDLTISKPRSERFDECAYWAWYRREATIPLRRDKQSRNLCRRSAKKSLPCDVYYEAGSACVIKLLTHKSNLTTAAIQAKLTSVGVTTRDQTGRLLRRMRTLKLIRSTRDKTHSGSPLLWNLCSADDV